MGDTIRTGGLSHFLDGIRAPFRALGTAAAYRGLWAYFIIPFVLNLVVLSVLLYCFYTAVYPWINGLIPGGQAWYLDFLRWLVSPVLFFIALLACGLLYSVTGTIISAPFNDPLSARVESLKGAGAAGEHFSITGFLGDAARALTNSVKLLLLLAVLNTAFLFLNLVPFAGGILYFVGSFFSALFFFGFGFFDFPLERRRMLFGRKVRLMWRYRYLTMGLGLGFFLITLIPVLGFLGLNLCTIGATELFLKHIRIADDHTG